MRTWVFASLPPIEVLAKMAYGSGMKNKGLACHAGGCLIQLVRVRSRGYKNCRATPPSTPTGFRPPMLQTFSPARSLAAGSLFDVDVSSCSQVPYLRVSARLPVKLWCIQKRQQVDWTRSPASEILPIAEGPRVILAACATGYSSVQRQAARALR